MSNQEKLWKYESAEALAIDVEKAWKLDLAKRIRDIEKNSIEQKTANWLEDLKNWLNENEEFQLREIIKDPEADNFFKQEKNNLDKIENLKQEELKKLIWDWSFSWVIWAALEPLKAEASNLKDKKWIDWLKSIDWFFWKIKEVFSNFKKWFSYLICQNFPSLASSLWIINPKNEIEQKAKEKIELEKSKIEKIKLEKTQNIKELAKLNYKTNWKIFFKIFSSNMDISDKSNLDNKDCEEVFNQMISNQEFLNSNYNSLNTPSTIDKIYEQLKDNESLKKYVESWTLKDIIKVNLTTFSWWNHTYKKYFWLSEETINTNSWKKFLEDMYAKKWQKIEVENPKINEILWKLNFLNDFENIINWEIDLDKIKWGALNILNTWSDWIAKLSDIDFERLKDNLPNKLREIDDFKFISQNMMTSNESRNLENWFSLSKWMNDNIWVNNNWEVLNFINELKIFWDQFYESYFKNSNTISWLNNISKSDITLKDIYQIYTITWWETNFNNLNTMQKANLIALSIYWFSDSYWVWKKLWELFSKNSNINIPEDVKLFFEKVATSLAHTTKQWIISWVKWYVWFAIEQPEIAAWLTAVALAWPFFTKKQSLLWVFTWK